MEDSPFPRNESEEEHHTTRSQLETARRALEEAERRASEAERRALAKRELADTELRVVEAYQTVLDSRKQLFEAHQTRELARQILLGVMEGLPLEEAQARAEEHLEAAIEEGSMDYLMEAALRELPSLDALPEIKMLDDIEGMTAPTAIVEQASAEPNEVLELLAEAADMSDEMDEPELDEQQLAEVDAAASGLLDTADSFVDLLMNQFTAGERMLEEGATQAQLDLLSYIETQATAEVDTQVTDEERNMILMSPEEYAEAYGAPVVASTPDADDIEEPLDDDNDEDIDDDALAEPQEIALFGVTVAQVQDDPGLLDGLLNQLDNELELLTENTAIEAQITELETMLENQDG